MSREAKGKMKKPSVGIVTHPGQGIRTTFFSSFFRMLLPHCESLTAITGDIPKISNKAIRIIRVPFRESGSHSLPSRISKYLLPQLRILPKLIGMSRNCNTIIFFDLAELYTMLILITKFFLRKKVIVVHCGLVSGMLQVTGGKKRLSLDTASSYLVRLLEKASFSLADGITIESKSIIESHGLQRYKHKTHICRSYYISTDSFKIERDIAVRRNLIGYIGRFGEDKGATNFAEALSKIAKPDDIEFLMLGGFKGEVSKMERILDYNKVQHKVTVMGFVSHQKIAGYLNKLKLLVLPSYGEGLPVTILEAMACGTPVLATPVGGIPDIIKDEETGFTLEDNSPECIAKNITRILEYPKLDEVIKRAHNLIAKEYSYEPTVKGWKEAFDFWGG